MPKPHADDLATAAVLVLAAMPGPAGTAAIKALLPEPLRDATEAQIGAALRAHPLCVSVARGLYAYLPQALDGSRTYLPGPLPAERGVVVLPDEALVLLWPEGLRRAKAAQRAAQVRLPDGRQVPWRPERVSATSAPTPEPIARRKGFWLTCVDAAARRFAIEPCPPPAPELEALREQRWRDLAASLMRPLQPYAPDLLARKLLGAGAYREDPPCATMADLAARPPFDRKYTVTYRPDLTAAMWRLFSHRSPMLQEPFTLPPPVARGTIYRLQVRLAYGRWQADLTVEAGHTLEDLHLLLQRVLDWDRDHLYAFYLSGRCFDHLTEVACPMAGDALPTTDQVTFGHFDPAPGQRFLYLFDFGDEWRFEITVTDRLPTSNLAGEPLCSAASGPPPRQYG